LDAFGEELGFRWADATAGQRADRKRERTDIGSKRG